MEINQRASLNQRETLILALKRDENISARFNLEDAWKNLENITSKQVAYFYALMFHKKYNKLNKILYQFKFQKKNDDIPVWETMIY